MQASATRCCPSRLLSLSVTLCPFGAHCRTPHFPIIAQARNTGTHAAGAPLLTLTPGLTPRPPPHTTSGSQQPCMQRSHSAWHERLDSKDLREPRAVCAPPCLDLQDRAEACAQHRMERRGYPKTRPGLPQPAWPPGPHAHQEPTMRRHKIGQGACAPMPLP